MVDYKKILSNSISEVKKRVKKLENPDYKKLMDIERRGKNRKGMKDYLKEKINKTGREVNKSKKTSKVKKSEIKMVDNLELHENKVIVSVNPYFYKMDVVYSSLYNFLDNCFCKVDGDPRQEILVELKPKDKKENLEKIGRKFNNEIINYAAREIRGLKTEGMRLEIVRRALTSHQPKENIEKPKKNLEDWENDPEGINIPWENKYGKGEVCD